MDDTRKPYVMWHGLTTFRRNGTPVLGTLGVAARQVVVMDADTFKRLIDENPQLATAQFAMAEV